MKIVSIVSGGLDSSVLAYDIASRGHEQVMVSFDYGQRHRRELRSAAALAERLSVEHRVVALPIRGLLHGSSLTDDQVAVPDGHYAEDTMRATVVPNRNLIMLSVAAGVAIAEGAAQVYTAVHAGDHFIYPDCRPEFIAAASMATRLATAGFGDVIIAAPFVNKTKAEIVSLGADLGVPFIETWSCYKGGDVHCGACGTCYERREAFGLAGVTDPTEYLDTPTYADPKEQ